MTACQLAGRNALVLGVERPAGRKAAVALAEAGADVAVVTLSEDTKAEFAANSTAQRVLGARPQRRRAHERRPRGDRKARDRSPPPSRLGPISILVWHAPHSIPQDRRPAVRPGDRRAHRRRPGD